MANYYQNLVQEYEASASSNPRNFKLIFSDDVINSPVFTKQNITGNDSIKVLLIDADTQKEVTTGLVASAKVKIVLLRGDYDGSTSMEDGDFEKKIVASWGKKKNALVGDGRDLYLKHGRGTVGEIRIQHDKHPIRNVEFRLGAMVVDCPSEVKVKEAITQSFKVKDRRNAPKSIRSLLLTDKVWQLKNIRKHGAIHKRLEHLKVYTVKDFLTKHHCNLQTLQEIYGVRGKKWETTVNHAKTCHISFDNDYNIPQLHRKDSYGLKMIVDGSFSIDEVEKYYDTDMWFCDEGKGVKAKKRWMKMRSFFTFIGQFIIVKQ